jgi:hydrogenase maturation protease
MAALCIGIGNVYRHDDGVGLYVARLLREQNLPDTAVIEHGGDGISLLELIADADTVILIDAISSGAAPGTLAQFAAHEHPLPARCFAHSSHAVGVAEAVELARALGNLPRCCVVYGIEGACFAAGVGLTPAVEQAARDLAAAIGQKWRSPQPHAAS